MANRRGRALPSFVRLPAEGDVLPIGILADVNGGTGWSISGLDVKETPEENDPAYDFVRTALNTGRLEPSTQEEFDAVQKAHAEVSRIHPVPDAEKPSPWNEPALVQTSKKLREQLVQGRRSGDFSSPEPEEDYADLKVDELRARLSGRGLDTTGTKAELVTRLEEADEAE